MVKNTKKISIAIFALMLTVGAQAQQSLWKSVSESRTASSELLQRNATPNEYQLFQLDMDALKTAFQAAPTKKSLANSNTVITLPTQDGKLQSFKLYKSSTLNESLQLRYNGISSYIAQGIDDPSAIARLSIGTDGVHAMITSSKHATVYVYPYVNTE